MKTGKPAVALFLLSLLLIYSPLKGEKNEDIIIEALTDELNRSMKFLKIKNMERPYYLDYTILDKWVLEIEAGFGSLIRSEVSQDRRLNVNLRVGSYQLDNTGFLDMDSMFAAFGGIRNIVLEDNYNAIRREVWLATDKAYKNALEQLADKRAFIKNNVQADEISDFSQEEPVQLPESRIFREIDRAKWEKTVKNLSALFRKFPAINESAVKLKVKFAHRYFVNSEGAVVRKAEPLVSLEAHASTQAADGMKLKHYIPFYATGIEGLPGEKDITAGIRKMAEELTALTTAPLLDEYIGPVLFSGQASAELFAQVLAPHLSGERPPLCPEPRLAERVFTGKLTRRINRRVLPREISISDDPGRSRFNKEPLIGSYRVDDQGVSASPVELVERGVLKTLLMSRRPSRDISNSNGHARAGFGGITGVHIANFFVTTEKGKSYREMKKELLQLCRDQQLPSGLIIKTLDNPRITGVDRSAASLYMRPDPRATQVTNPVLVYRVHVKDGREELVRGITFSEVNLRSLKDILAVGNDYTVHHRLFTGGGIGGFSFGFSMRGGSEMGIPASIVAPSVLVEELEFKKAAETRKTPPLLIHPFFSK